MNLSTLSQFFKKEPEQTTEEIINEWEASRKYGMTEHRAALFAKMTTRLGLDENATGGVIAGLSDDAAAAKIRELAGLSNDGAAAKPVESPVHQR